MKQFLYSIIGLVIGGLLGYYFFGNVYNIAYTKKQEVQLTKEIQKPIFGVIGAIFGCIIGSKMGRDEGPKLTKDDLKPFDHSKRSTIINSKGQTSGRLITACKKCKKGVGYYREERQPEYCERCKQI